jgi:hypothetical protein
MNIDTATTGTLRGNFVLLRADKLRLLLPQEQVGEASYLEEPPEPTELPGVFLRASEAGDDLIVALSSRMRPMQSFPQDRFFITKISAPQGEVAFGWSDVQVLIDAELRAQRLPAPLDWEHGPLRSFVEIDGEVVFCCDAQRLTDSAFTQGT